MTNRLINENISVKILNEYVYGVCSRRKEQEKGKVR